MSYLKGPRPSLAPILLATVLEEFLALTNTHICIYVSQSKVRFLAGIPRVHRTDLDRPLPVTCS